MSPSIRRRTRLSYVRLDNRLIVFAGSPHLSSATGSPPTAMNKRPEVVADDEEPGPEPEGFWDPVHAEVTRLSRIGADGDDTASGS
jgi:hypothetical protein